LNQDSYADIIWRNTQTGLLVVWLMEGSSKKEVIILGTVTLDWTIVDVKDVNSDNYPDIEWRNSKSGQLYTWLMKGTQKIGALNLGSVTTTWEVVHDGDMDGDGLIERLWRNSQTGMVVVWQMSQTGTRSAVKLLGKVATNWKMETISDLNGDGIMDISWRNSTDGMVVNWIVNSSLDKSSVDVLGKVATSWELIANIDINGDALLDKVWFEPTSGKVALWMMRDEKTKSSVNLLSATFAGYTLEKVLDMDGDGLVELLFSSGELSKIIELDQDGAIETSTTQTFKLQAWADNWFAAYLGEELIVEDSVPITTERSFNAETKLFSASYPLQLNFILKDYKQNDTGLEYIGQSNQQMGDGGFIMQITDMSRGTVVGVSNANMRCTVIHRAPLDKACANEQNPTAGVSPCLYESQAEPIGWKSSGYDASSWESAMVYSESEVSPKDGYSEISWDSSAKLIWGSDLEQDNTILCKLTIQEPQTTTQTTRCQTIKESISKAGFDDVAVSCDETYAYITSDTYPSHDKMNGITGTNEQIPVPAKDYSAPIRLNPSGVSNLTTIDASLGVAINGVPIYDYSSQGELDVTTYDANIDTFLLGQLDNCGGHAGRGDDYHYHARPTCMIESMLSTSDSAIIGWAHDGYPIYDLKNPDGSTIAQGDLDICHGQVDSTFGYRYHTSLSAPYVLQCLRGEVDTAILPRVAPMSGRTVGTPPQGGVENLRFTQNGTLVRMEYSYQGESYYLQYQPSNTADCYLFETKTLTDGGVIKEGEFCR
jgi:hypothetical protein